VCRTPTKTRKKSRERSARFSFDIDSSHLHLVGTDHHAWDSASFGVSFLPEVHVVELHPHDILLGRLEMFALFWVALDLCDSRLRNLGVVIFEEG